MEDPEDEEIEVGDFLSERNFEDIVIVKAAIVQSKSLFQDWLKKIVEKMIAEGELYLFIDDEEK